MARYLFRPSPVPSATSVRIDTASGSDSPADIRPLGSGTAVEGSVLRSRDGELPPFRGPDGVSTLYLKRLDYRGQVTGGPTRLVGTGTVPDTQPDAEADRRARTRRTNPPRWTQAGDGLGALTSAGLTTTGGYIAATVAGTDGTAVLPLWGERKDLRASFRVKATKTTAGSKSLVGFTVSQPGVLPSGTGPTTAGVFAAGYLQGTGIVIARENISTPILVLADASLTDGADYQVSVWVDCTLNVAAGSTTGAVRVRVRDATGADLADAGTSFTLSLYAVNNGIIRTNVAAGGVADVQITAHPLGPVGYSTAGEAVYTPTSLTETAYVLTPAAPNGHLVLALHGHGGTPTETGWTSTSYRPTWDALMRAGFTIAVPKMGGNLWGNDVALQYVIELYNTLRARFDLERDVFLWGNSMGGGAAATLIARGALPVRAAYLAQPAVDYDGIAANPSFATILTAYPTVVERDANNPLKQPASSYTVPMLVVASAADTAVPKTANANALAALAGSNTLVRQFTATGDHNDPSHFRPVDTADFFRAAA